MLIRHLTLPLLLLVAAAAPHGAAAASSGACAAKGSRTVLRTESIRIYRPASPTLDQKNIRYACAYRTNRRVVLNESAATRLSHYAVRGTKVAFAATAARSGRRSIVLEDVARRRTVFDVWATQLPVGDSGSPGVTQLSMNKRGDVAWIVFNRNAEQGAGFEVHVRVAGARRLLDVAPDVDPQSLALTETRAYWTRGGQPQVAALR